jgi:hypothetical protein
MARIQMLAIIFSSLAYLGYANNSANAGWFGPSNYQECVLAEMKGRPGYMMSTAQKACEIKFPCPDKYHEDEYHAAFNSCIASVTPGEDGTGCLFLAQQLACPDRH